MSQLVSSLQTFFKPREVFITGIVCLLVLVSLGILSLAQMPDVVSTNVQATAAVQMKAISAVYVATSSARSRATTTVQAHSTATVQVRATATALVIDSTATAIASGNPYPPHGGTLALDDTLRNNSANAWADEASKNGSCSFVGGTYRAKSVTSNITFGCPGYYTEFSNFVYQVQITILSGDEGGITFREDTQGHQYTFLIRSDGTYGFYKFEGYGKTVSPLISGSSSAIKKGLKQTNLIAVIARGKTIDLYVNQRRVTSVGDGAYSKGAIAVCASATAGTTEVAFNNAKVWTL
ncbi:hypothetical protein [Reticulibacter mediterranei]|nr:hypothetical protein [Reticulibacter mediterranei]